MSQSEPLVSVVIPTYNRSELVKEAVQSVQKQSYNNVETIVVDDASDLEHQEQIKEVDSFDKTTLVQHDVNRGGSGARNTGISHAKGEYIAFLDDDDRWTEQKLERQVRAFEHSSPEVGVVYSGVRHIEKDTGRIVRERVPSRDGDVHKRILLGNFVSTFSAVMIRQEVVDNVGLLDEEFPSWQDWEWLTRIAREYEFGVVSEPDVIHQSTDGHNIGQNIEGTSQLSYPRFVGKFKHDARRYGRLFSRKFDGWTSYRVACNAMSNREYSVARSFLFQSIKSYPIQWRYWFLFVLSVLSINANLFQKILPDKLVNGTRELVINNI